MSGTSIGTIFNFGYAGTVSRLPDVIIEEKPVRSTSGNINFGAGVVLDTATNTFVDVGTITPTAANFAGVAVAEVKQSISYPNGQNIAQGGYYAASQPCDVMQRGIITVYVGAGTPVVGIITGAGAVYLRYSANTGTYPASIVGTFDAVSDGGHNVLLTNCVWNTGLVDANGMAELKILSINN